MLEFQLLLPVKCTVISTRYAYLYEAGGGLKYLQWLFGSFSIEDVMIYVVALLVGRYQDRS